MDSHDLTAACKELGQTDATQCVVVGNHVYDPLLFAPEIIPFTRKQYLFLNAYKLGVSLEEAATKAELTVETCKRFLDKDTTVKWLNDRARKDHIRNEWQEPGKWWEMGNQVLEGKKQFSKAQIVIYQEFGQRICPKSKESSEPAPKAPTIILNFSADSVKDAFQRQASIETELIKAKQ